MPRRSDSQQIRCEVVVERAQDDSGELVRFQHASKADLSRRLEGQKRNGDKVEEISVRVGGTGAGAGAGAEAADHSGAVAHKVEVGENGGDDNQDGLDGEGGDEDGASARGGMMARFGVAVEDVEEEGAKHEGAD